VIGHETCRDDSNRLHAPASGSLQNRLHLLDVGTDKPGVIGAGWLPNIDCNSGRVVAAWEETDTIYMDKHPHRLGASPSHGRAQGASVMRASPAPSSWLAVTVSTPASKLEVTLPRRTSTTGALSRVRLSSVARSSV
jgi:hypothetical protein